MWKWHSPKHVVAEKSVLASNKDGSLAISHWNHAITGHNWMANSQVWPFTSQKDSCRSVMTAHFYWLVVSTPLKNISQLWWLFPIWKNKIHVPNHQPVNEHRMITPSKEPSKNTVFPRASRLFTRFLREEGLDYPPNHGLRVTWIERGHKWT